MYGSSQLTFVGSTPFRMKSLIEGQSSLLVATRVAAVAPAATATPDTLRSGR
jgi:hypothetical protein